MQLTYTSLGAGQSRWPKSVTHRLQGAIRRCRTQRSVFDQVLRLIDQTGRRTEHAVMGLYDD